MKKMISTPSWGWSPFRRKKPLKPSGRIISAQEQYRILKRYFRAVYLPDRANPIVDPGAVVRQLRAECIHRIPWVVEDCDCDDIGILGLAAMKGAGVVGQCFGGEMDPRAAAAKWSFYDTFRSSCIYIAGIENIRLPKKDKNRGHRLLVAIADQGLVVIEEQVPEWYYWPKHYQGIVALG